MTKNRPDPTPWTREYFETACELARAVSIVNLEKLYVLPNRGLRRAAHKLCSLQHRFDWQLRCAAEYNQSRRLRGTYNSAARKLQVLRMELGTWAAIDSWEEV